MSEDTKKIILVVIVIAVLAIIVAQVVMNNSRSQAKKAAIEKNSDKTVDMMPDEIQNQRMKQASESPPVMGSSK
jgi:ABC-type lipoprotein release transport system permease subunit